MSINLQGLVLLLLFIAPGFLYSRAYLAARPRYQRSPDLFEQTVLAVIGSTFIHAGLIGSLSLFVLIYTAWTRRALLVRELLYIPVTVADAPVSIVVAYSLTVSIYIIASLITRSLQPLNLLHCLTIVSCSGPVTSFGLDA